MEGIYERTYTAYSEREDITFILKDTVDSNSIISTEVTGFYYGPPNVERTVYFKDKLKATF